MALGNSGAMRFAIALIAVFGFGVTSAAPAHSRNWEAIDVLRQRLEAKGARVVQRDCDSLPRVQGLYHRPSDQIVICRVHSNPAAVWDTLAHEAAHRMQACYGGSLTRPALHRQMARTLAQRYPHELASLQLYPASRRLSELEARYTAKLDPDQVLSLFQRYCG